MKGGFFLKKKPLECVAPVYSNPENAIARFRRICALAEFAAGHGATPAQLSLAWLLERSPVLLPIPGTSKIPHLEENLRAGGLRHLVRLPEFPAGPAGC
ncbi:MAG: aldo/keto reductase [Terracidiphilus sp.]